MINQFVINWTVVYNKLFLKSFVIGKFKCTSPFFFFFKLLFTLFWLQMTAEHYLKGEINSVHVPSTNFCNLLAETELSTYCKIQ